jgi:hypothetical protein
MYMDVLENSMKQAGGSARGQQGEIGRESQRGRERKGVRKLARPLASHVQHVAFSPIL